MWCLIKMQLVALSAVWLRLKCSYLFLFIFSSSDSIYVTHSQRHRAVSKTQTSAMTWTHHSDVNKTSLTCIYFHFLKKANQLGCIKDTKWKLVKGGKIYLQCSNAQYKHISANWRYTNGGFNTSCNFYSELPVVSEKSLKKDNICLK